MFSAVVAATCLFALRWLFWATAALLLVLLAVQFIRGDADARPLTTAGTALAMAALGWICGAAGRRLVPR